MALDKQWRKATAQVSAARTLGELVAFELEENDGSPRQSVLRAIGERAADLAPDITAAEREAALDALGQLDDSKVLAAVGGAPAATSTEGETLPRVAKPSAVSVEPTTRRIVGPLVRVRRSDGSFEAVGLGDLRRRGR